MATLANARLAITVNLPARNARVVVTGDARFTVLETFLMQNGLRFKMDCKVWGEDNGQGAWIDPDDHLFNYASKFFPDATPTAVERVNFDTTVPLTRLQEDSGTDEIYGELILTNLQDGSRKKLKTNVIVFQFG